MGRHLLRRSLIAVPSLLGISIVLFAVLALAPGDPIPASPFQEEPETAVPMAIAGTQPDLTAARGAPNRCESALRDRSAGLQR
jgi:ABC-type microcin C transport system permease subunit YejB